MANAIKTVMTYWMDFTISRKENIQRHRSIRDKIKNILYARLCHNIEVFNEINLRNLYFLIELIIIFVPLLNESCIA